eukprot:9515091-Heterocapsa_arctica.AAC.1
MDDSGWVHLTCLRSSSDERDVPVRLVALDGHLLHDALGVGYPRRRLSRWSFSFMVLADHAVHAHVASDLVHLPLRNHVLREVREHAPRVVRRL